MITVVSTGLAPPTGDLCRASVRAQRGVEVEHRWIDAIAQEPRKGVLENLCGLVSELPSDRIVCWLDLDDHLAHRDVLAGVKRLHDDGAWVTYGSFQTYAGQVVVCPPYESNPRTEPWHASHLRTFNAGVFRQIPPQALREAGGAYLRLAVDQAVMIALCELAGLERVRAVSDIRCIYNEQNAWEARASEAELADEKLAVHYIKSMTPCSKLDSFS